MIFFSISLISIHMMHLIPVYMTRLMVFRLNDGVKVVRVL